MATWDERVYFGVGRHQDGVGKVRIGAALGKREVSFEISLQFRFLSHVAI